MRAAIDRQVERSRCGGAVSITNRRRVGTRLRRIDIERDLIAGIGTEVKVGVTNRAFAEVAEIIGIIGIDHAGDSPLSGATDVGNGRVLALQSNGFYHHAAIVDGHAITGLGFVTHRVSDDQRDGDTTALVAEIYRDITVRLWRYFAAGRAAVEADFVGHDIVIGTGNIEQRRGQLIRLQGILGGGQRQIAIFVRAVIGRDRACAPLGDFDTVDIGTGCRAFWNRQFNTIATRLQGDSDGFEQPVVETFYRTSAIRISRQHIEDDRGTAIDH